jgi:hypothetical protein
MPYVSINSVRPVALMLHQTIMVACRLGFL